MIIIFRPQIVLQTAQQNFVGSTPDDKVKTRSTAEVFNVEYHPDGKYSIQTRAGKVHDNAL